VAADEKDGSPFDYLAGPTLKKIPERDSDSSI
jgi:hypothetical protein